MSNFYNRLWSVDINDQPFIQATTGLQFRTRFEVLHDFGGYTSYLDQSFYNLSDSTVANLFRRDRRIVLRAGYDDSIDTIFSGRIRNIFKERNGPDTLTRVVARGGSATSSTVRRSFGANISVVELIKTCVTSMGYPIVIEEDQFTNIPPYTRGYTLNGNPRVFLDNLAKTHGFSYVIDKERIVVVRDGAFRQGDVALISKETGMESIPEVTEVGLDVRTRLNPRLRIGGRFQARSEFQTFNFSNIYYQDVPASAGKGVYNIFRLGHSGDSWGDEWTTTVTGLR